MQYLSELPQIGSIGVDGDIIELELEQEVEQLPDHGVNDPIVLTADFSGQIVVTAGQVIEYKKFEGTDAGCRIKIKGSSVTFTI